jgi:hypothetical protein
MANHNSDKIKEPSATNNEETGSPGKKKISLSELVKFLKEGGSMMIIGGFRPPKSFSQQKESKWEVKAPEWFVNDMELGEKILEEVMKDIGAKKEWFWEQPKGEYDTERLKQFLILKVEDGLLSKEKLEEILSKLILRAAISKVVWNKFRKEYPKENPNTTIPDVLIYNPETKIISELQQ